MNAMSDTTPETTPAADDIPSPEEIPALRVEIDRLDTAILELIEQRTAAPQRVARARTAAGRPRIVYSREMTVLNRFAELGDQRRELAMLLLKLRRGRLGAR